MHLDPGSEQSHERIFLTQNKEQECNEVEEDGGLMASEMEFMVETANQRQRVPEISQYILRKSINNESCSGIVEASKIKHSRDFVTPIFKRGNLASS